MTWERGQTDEDMHTASPKLVSAVENMFWLRRAIFISGGTGSDSFQINNYLNQNLRGGIVMTRALEVV